MIGIAIFFFIFFWSVPVLFVAGLANIENLSKLQGLAWLKKISELSPFLVGVIQGFVPSLLLFVYGNIVVDILRKMIDFCGPRDKPTRERIVMQAYWAYLLFNNLLVSAIGGLTLFS